jgi:hypothetical protein
MGFDTGKRIAGTRRDVLGPALLSMKYLLKGEVLKVLPHNFQDDEELNAHSSAKSKSTHGCYIRYRDFLNENAREIDHLVMTA